MAKVIMKAVPRRVGSQLKNYLPYIKKTAGYFFRWRVFWTLVMAFVLATVYYPVVGDRVVDFMARQNPPLAKLPDNAKPDFSTTVTYKKEKLTVVRTNLDNIILIIQRNLGLKEAVVTKPAGAAPELPVMASVEKTVVPEMPEGENHPDRSDLGLIKDNLVGAAKAYFDMLTVKIVMIDEKPVMIGENGEVIPYDKTDRILRWGRLIEAAAEKYQTDPAIIAAIIEQESGGNASAVSRAGAIGLMQLMPGTARGLGVNPYDPEQNIDGGTRYFLQQYKTFGSVEQALGAYNAGPNNVRNGRYLYIPETRNYIRNVPRLIEKYRAKFANSQKAVP